MEDKNEINLTFMEEVEQLNNKEYHNSDSDLFSYDALDICLNAINLFNSNGCNEDDNSSIFLSKANSATNVHCNKSHCVCTVQVCFFNLSNFGIGKGMLIANHGIKQIQIPQSMPKVERSKTNSLHKSV